MNAALPELPPAVLRALADRRAPLPAPSVDARAAAMLRAHVLSRVAPILAAEGLPVLLVKGAALALTVYPEPAARSMSDVDLLVRPAHRERVISALARSGLGRPEPFRRAHSQAFFRETQLVARAGAAELLLEIHTSLDKVVPRPIDEAGLFARAVPAPGLPGLLVPDPLDHLLLVILHAAGHHFDHPAAYLDMELLLRSSVDQEALAARARAWALGTATFAALSALRELGSATVRPEILARLDPGPLRRAALARAARVGESLGAAWFLRQAPLRDDLGAFALGLGRYAAARLADQVASPSAAGQDAAVPYRVPPWIRAFLAADRLAERLQNLREGLRDEVLLAWVPEAERAALTAALYSAQATYLPGGHRFQAGLFGWEKSALAAPVFPRAGRALVGACGAGREVKALVDRGFAVVGFDPCAPFVEAARAALPADRVALACGTYAELVDAAAGRGGPLAEVAAGPPFDLVILGWGSFSHVMPARARGDLLRAVRALAPAAPVLASFAVDGAVAQPVPGKGRVRDGLRRVFGALRAPGSSEPGDRFFPNSGFFAYLTRDELHELAAAAGYAVELYEEAPYPHAVLAPR